MTPISFGGSGPESANVKKIATITAAAARLDRESGRLRGDETIVCLLTGSAFAQDATIVVLQPTGETRNSLPVFRPHPQGGIRPVAIRRAAGAATFWACRRRSFNL